MPVSLIPSFLLYVYVSGITPGPANLASLAAAIRYGKDSALRQWRGLFTGFAVISLVSVLIVWLLGTALNRYVNYFSWVGAIYILWLAWHMLRPAKKAEEKDPATPTFRTGFLLQMTNVKIMVLCLTTLSGYVLPYNQSLPALLPVGLFLPLTGPVMNLLWLLAGAKLRRFYSAHRRIIDIVMALALVLCAVSLVWPHR